MEIYCLLADVEPLLSGWNKPIARLSAKLPKLCYSSFLEVHRSALKDLSAKAASPPRSALHS